MKKMNKASLVLDDIKNNVARIEDIRYYPPQLIDPCLLPSGRYQGESVRKKVTSWGTHIVSSEKGLPYGVYSRLVISNIIRDIKLGYEFSSVTMSQYVRHVVNACSLGSSLTGGETGNRAIVTNQIVRALSLEYFATEEKYHHHSEMNANTFFYKNKYCLEKLLPIPTRSLIDMEKRAFPVDLRALNYFRLNNSLLAIDLYLFFTHQSMKCKRSEKVFSLERMMTIFMLNESYRKDNFKMKLEKAIALVLQVYPELKIRKVGKDYLYIKSAPHVPPVNKS